MEFRVLGPLEVVRDGAVVQLEGRVRRRLLERLLLTCDQPVTTDALIDSGWGETPPRTARRTLQSHVSQMRSIGLDIDRANETYRLVADPLSVDAHRFRRFCEASTFANATRTELGEALSWWRGEPWSELATVFIPHDVVELLEYRDGVEERIAIVDLEVGDFLQAEAVAGRIATTNPRREAAWGIWAVAVFAQHRRSEALDVLDRARRAIGDSGLPPGPMLEALGAALVADRPLADSLGILEGNGRPTRRERAAGPPPGPERLIGRVELCRRVGALLENRRLITLTGAPGVGKTQLAARVSAQFGDRFLGSRHWCDLVAASDERSVSFAVAASVGVAVNDATGVEGALIRGLQGGRALLVLDNCEHVRTAVFSLVSRLLAAAPEVTVLATSREPIGWPDEDVIVVPPLGDDDAVGLLVERAARASSVALADHASPDEIAELCSRLGRLPLAIELAAARLRSMSVSELLDRLDSSIEVLADSHRHDARHRGLDAALDASVDLLDDEERLVFEKLSVFTGGFGMSDAEAVVGATGGVGDVVDVVDQLVRVSLVEAEPLHHPHRLTMLEPIRSYALARLADSGGEHDTRRSHAAAFAGARSGPVSEPDMGNLRAAVAWLHQHGPTEQLLELVHGLRADALVRGIDEVGDWCRAAIERTDAGSHPLGSQVAGLAAHLAYFRGDRDAAWEFIGAAERMPAFTSATLHPTYVRAALLHHDGDTPEVRALLAGIDRSDPLAFVTVNAHLVRWAPDPVHDPQAVEAFAQLELIREMPEARPFYLSALAVRAVAEGDHDAARCALDEQFALTRDGPAWTQTNALLQRAGAWSIALRTIDDTLIVELIEALDLAARHGRHLDRWNLLRSASFALWARGDRSTAPLLRAAFEVSPWSVPEDAQAQERAGAFAELLPAACDRLDHAAELDLDELTDIARRALAEVTA